MNKFQLGDNVWFANSHRKEKTMPCTECAGKKKLTVIYGYNKIWEIECGCGHELDIPTGGITYYEYSPETEHGVIDGVSVKKEGIEYHIQCDNHAHCVYEDKAFDNKEDADKDAIRQCEEHNKLELDKITNKEKPTKTWAWNFRYHNREIKNHEQQLEYHKRKLVFAGQHRKEGDA